MQTLGQNRTPTSEECLLFRLFHYFFNVFPKLKLFYITVGLSRTKATPSERAPTGREKEAQTFVTQSETDPQTGPTLREESRQ